MYIDPIATRFRKNAKLVGFCDINPVRMAYHNRRLKEQFNHDPVPTFEDFDRMVRESRPDIVIVTTMDCVHDKYIVRAMELGCDVITEKPMTIDDVRCQAIFDAIERTGQNLRMAFNYRWGPGPTTVRQLLSEGTIGEVIHVDMEYMLNTSHGADYFRRWHREKDKSGGLIVHKATHHFDLVNWWVDAVPQMVFGFGRLAFYGRENAERRGIEVKYDRYTGNDTAGDPFALDLSADEALRGMYLEAEAHDGYQRDRNVFGDGITSDDTMSVLVKYRTGVTLNYSLNAFVPREGFHVVFNGTRGRIEYQEAHSSHIIAGHGDKELADEMKWKQQVIVHPMFQRAYQVEVPKAEGGHGGGDPLLQEQIFSDQPPVETFGRNAGHGQGAASILIGVAANRSFASGQPVCIESLCPQIGSAVRLSDLP